jgi:hypothetical protein
MSGKPFLRNNAQLVNERRLALGTLFRFNGEFSLVDSCKRRSIVTMAITYTSETMSSLGLTVSSSTLAGLRLEEIPRLVLAWSFQLWRNLPMPKYYKEARVQRLSAGST